MLILSIPAVQTSLGKYATKKLNEKYNTNITISKVGLQFNGDVELKGIYVIDHKDNNLITIDELNTSIINVKNIYDGKLTFGDIDIITLNFAITTYKGETDTNLDVFVDKFEDDQPKTSESEFLLSSSDVSIYDSHFLLIDENKENPKKLDFENLNINATNFLINGPDVSARINSLAFVDSRGVEVTKMKTNFLYTLQNMVFNDLTISTPKSSLSGNLRFDYEREDLQFFEDKVKVTADFKNSKVALNELNTFYNEFGTNQIVTLNTSLSGTLNNLNATNLRLRNSSKTIINGDINFKNLFNSEEDNFVMDGDFKNLSSNYYDLRALLPNILGEAIPSSFKRLGDFKIVGKSIITSKDIKADIDIETDLGYIVSDMELTKIDNIDNASYKGNIVFDEFDLGAFLEDPMLGTTSFNLDVDGYGFTMENLNTQVKGEVYGLKYNNYAYKLTNVSGNLKNKVFNGKLTSDDTNLKLDFNGLVDYSNANENIYDFTANVGHADLRALQFVTRDSLSVFKGNVTMNMKGKTIDDVYGTIAFNNTLYKNENDSYYFKDFSIESQFKGTVREIDINSPEIIEGRLQGKFNFRDVQKLVENSVGSIYTNYKPHELEPNQFIDYNFKIYSKIAEVFLPSLKIGVNTTLRGRIESDASAFKLKLKAPRLQYDENFADKIDVTIDNSNPLFNTYITADSLYTKYYALSEFDFINTTKNDSLFIKTQFKGGPRNDDEFDLNLYYTINTENNSVVGFKKSDITFKENDWLINRNSNNLHKVIFDRNFKNFDIKEFLMNHNNEAITLSGVINDTSYKDIKLDFENVDLAKITPEIDSLALAGNVNGKLHVLQQNGSYLPESNITIDNFEINRINLGSFKADIKGNQSLTNYDVDITLKDDDTKSLSAIGNIDVSRSKPTINLDVKFNDFILNPLNPFGEGVITNIRGKIDGTAQVTGSLNKPDINGNLVLNDGGLSIPELNVDYSLEDNASITLREQRFIFNTAQMVDTEYYSKSKLSGFVSHTNFSNWELGLKLSTNRLLILNTEDSDEALYYGTAFVSGDAEINGPTNQLTISSGNLRTEPGTEFKIPLNNAESYGDNSFIHFLTPEEKIARKKGEVTVVEDVSGLTLDFNLAVTDDAEVEIIIDKNSGHALKGKGQGELLIEINTNGKFNMYGDYIVFEGTYNFVYGGLVQKQFIVEPGGSIAWNQDPLKPNLDLKAIYKTQANPSVLLDNPINRSIPVDVEILLSGDLEQPTPNFNLVFPNVNSTIKSELDYRLEDKENRELQALSLLTSGTFINRVTIGQQAIYGNLAERASAIINSLFSDGDSKLKLGLDYQIGEVTPEYETDDRIGLTIQTKISDRILFNGKVGVPIGGVSESVVAGDAQLDFLLNEDGTLTAKVFNRENNIRNFGEEIGYTQGVGLSYTIEFDTFKELIQTIIKGKKHVQKEAEKADLETEKNRDKDLVPSYVKFKSKSNNNN